MDLILVKELSEKLGVAFGTSGVRGRVEDLTSELCYAYTKAFLQVLGNVKKVAIGIDLRPSSPLMAKACVRAVQDCGVEVEYFGSLPTPALAYYSIQEKIPAVMITGSHIPFDRNGIKFYKPEGEISKQDEALILNEKVNIPEFLYLYINNFYLGAPSSAAITRFKKRYKEFFASDLLLGKRVGIYEHSSVARDLLRDLLSSFGADVISLDRTDSFVPIDTEAVSAEDIAKGKHWSDEYKLDLIVSTDGDGDRPLVADEQGNWLRGDVLGFLCAQYLNASHVAAPINVNSILDKIPSVVAKTKIGSPYVIEAMDSWSNNAEAPAIVGFEANGGFLIGSDLNLHDRSLSKLPTRDSVLPMLIMSALTKEANCSLSKIVGALPRRYTSSDRIKEFSSERSKNLLASLINNEQAVGVFVTSILGLKDVDILRTDLTDGVRFILDNDEIIHFRASGNAPELRCYAESSSQKRSDDLVAQALSKVKSNY
jgi:phosphomannomutase